MSDDNISKALENLFSDNRIVFWYDEEEKLREQFEEVTLNKVEKIIVSNNEFSTKYRVKSSDVSDKFLLYFPEGEKPIDYNWLLDLQLAHRVFHTDQEAMFLQELGLDYYFKELVTQHLEFFRSKERRAKLKELLAEDDKDRDIQYKMMAVLFGTSYPTLEAFIQSYAEAFNNDNNRLKNSLEKYNLTELFWRDVSRKFNYQSDSPSIYDFLLDVFSRNFSLTADGKSARESRILISLWKDAISYQESFQGLSTRISQELDIARKLDAVSLDDVIDEDIFKVIDFKILHELINSLTHESIDLDKLTQYIKKRENKYWFHTFKHFYACLEHGGTMISLIRKASSLNFGSIEEGAVSYSNQLFLIDYHYRKFIHNYRLSSQNSAMSELYDKVNKVYSNDWLLTGNDEWQKTVDVANEWPVHSKHAQSKFFKHQVKPFISKGQRLFVVISDALRYENGHELYKKLQSEKRYEADLDYLISGLPSYTQLGMASLLPNEQLNISPKDCSVIVDGKSSIGIQGRTKILQANSGVRATAILAENFMKMNANKEGREFAKEHDLIYIYHNHIDKVGDDTTSEVEVFEAVDKELDFISKILKQIANMNGNNVLITADHGYIYQNEPIEESDFTESKAKGDTWKENRRFVIGGKNLEGGPAVKTFDGTEVGLTSDVRLLIPKGINRLRVKGAGSRFVHGGASLQEIVVPMLRVAKKRQDTTKQVDVEIIKSTDKITTNILAVSFIQKELITDKILPRQIRAFIQAEDGTQLSDMFAYSFDISEGTERERAITHRFQLSAIASGKYKNQRVSLILQEPVTGSSKWKLYEEHFYTLNISFMNDFDDF